MSAKTFAMFLIKPMCTLCSQKRKNKGDDIESLLFKKRDNNILRHLCKDDDDGLVGRLHPGRGLLAGDRGVL